MSEAKPRVSGSLKLILERDGVKREIHAPFRLLIRRAHLELLREQIEHILRDEDYYYGWRTIWPGAGEPCVNSPPQPWAGGGAEGE